MKWPSVEVWCARKQRLWEKLRLIVGTLEGCHVLLQLAFNSKFKNSFTEYNVSKICISIHMEVTLTGIVNMRISIFRQSYSSSLPIAVNWSILRISCTKLKIFRNHHAFVCETHISSHGRFQYGYPNRPINAVREARIRLASRPHYDICINKSCFHF